MATLFSLLHLLRRQIQLLSLSLSLSDQLLFMSHASHAIFYWPLQMLSCQLKGNWMLSLPFSLLHLPSFIIIGHKTITLPSTALAQIQHRMHTSMACHHQHQGKRNIWHPTPSRTKEQWIRRSGQHCQEQTNPWAQLPADRKPCTSTGLQQEQTTFWTFTMRDIYRVTRHLYPLRALAGCKLKTLSVSTRGFSMSSGPTTAAEK